MSLSTSFTPLELVRIDCEDYPLQQFLLMEINIMLALLIILANLLDSFLFLTNVTFYLLLKSLLLLLKVKYLKKKKKNRSDGGGEFYNTTL